MRNGATLPESGAGRKSAGASPWERLWPAGLGARRALRRRRNPRGRRGVVLMIALWVLVILGLIALEVTIEVRRNVRITGYHRDDLIALNLARAGVGRAVCDLKNDLLADNDPVRKNYDALSDIWQSKATPEEPEKVGEGQFQGQFWYRVVDEESKININRASAELIYQALIYLGVDEVEAEHMAGAIVDWRDPDGKPRFLNPEVKERAMVEIYETRSEDELIDPETGMPREIGENLVYGRKCRNEDYMVLEELLDVWGVTPELLYGRDPIYDPLPPDPFPIKIDQEGDLRGRQRRRLERRDIGLSDIFTAHPTAGLNVNTAGLDPLAVLFATGLRESAPEDDLDRAKEMAQAVLRWRGDIDRMNDERNVIRNIAEVTQIESFSAASVAKLKRHQPLVAQSRIFTIYSEGSVRSSRSLLGVTVSRQLARYILQPDEKDAGLFRGKRSAPRSRGTPENVFEEPYVQCINWMEW